MLLQIVDAVGIMDGFIFFQLIESPQTVFNDQQRDLITGIELVQRETKTIRIDLPAPFTRCKIWVLGTTEKIAGTFGDRAIARHAIGLIVGQRKEINFSFLEYFKITFFDVQCDPVIFPEFFRKVRIGSPDLHIGAIVLHIPPVLLIQQHVFGIRSERIDRHHGDHVSDLEIPVDLMAFSYRQCGSQKLMMQSLVAQVLVIHLI